MAVEIIKEIKMIINIQAFIFGLILGLFMVLVIYGLYRINKCLSMIVKLLKIKNK